MRLEKIDEYAIDSKTTQAIQELLQESFELFPNNRTFYKQVPTFRLLLWDDTHLIAQVGVVFRVVSLDNEPFRIFGLMDLCVDKHYRSKKVGAQILTKIEKIGKANQIDFILLVEGIKDYYTDKGFEVVENTCRWVLIKDYQTLGVLNRQIPNTLLVKALSGKPWNNKANLDLMGFIF